MPLFQKTLKQKGFICLILQFSEGELCDIVLIKMKIGSLQKLFCYFFVITYFLKEKHI